VDLKRFWNLLFQLNSKIRWCAGAACSCTDCLSCCNRFRHCNSHHRMPMWFVATETAPHASTACLSVGKAHGAMLRSWTMRAACKEHAVTHQTHVILVHVALQSITLKTNARISIPPGAGEMYAAPVLPRTILSLRGRHARRVVRPAA
jgi:hypothetical protein